MQAYIRHEWDIDERSMRGVTRTESSDGGAGSSRRARFELAYLLDQFHARVDAVPKLNPVRVNVEACYALQYW